MRGSQVTELEVVFPVTHTIKVIDVILQEGDVEPIPADEPAKIDILTNYIKLLGDFHEMTSKIVNELNIYYKEKLLSFKKPREYVLKVRGLEEVLNIIEHKADEISKVLAEIKRKDKLKESLRNLEKTLLLMSPFKGMDISISDIFDKKWICIKVFLVKNVDKDDIEKILNRNGFAYQIFPAKDHSIFLVATLKMREERLVKLLEPFSIEQFEPTEEIPSQVGEALSFLENKINAIKKELSDIDDFLNRWKREQYFDVLFLKEATEILRNILEQFSLSIETLFTGFSRDVELASLRFFAPNKIAVSIKRRLEKEIDKITVHLKTLTVELNPPRLPSKIPLFSDVKANVLGMYGGWPGAREIDPGVIVVITFPFFFGFMFGDIGHGIVLLISGLVIKYLAARKYRQWGSLLTLMGVFSMIFGTLSGEFFGTPIKIPGYQPFMPLFEDHSIHMGGVYKALGLSLLIGVIHLTIALSFRVINEIRRGETVPALARSLPLLIFYVSGVIVVGATDYAYNIIPKEFATPFMPILAFSALLTLIGEPLAGFVGKVHARSPLSLLGETSLELVLSILEFLSNTISYTRLAIYYIIHAILTSTVNSFWSFGAMALPLVALGQASIIFMEAFFAYIQDLRLHFYEFFSKFFEGEGRLLKPVNLEGKICKIVFTRK